jgi:hypothetical protein
MTLIIQKPTGAKLNLAKTFSLRSALFAGTQGVWYDPSDLSTVFQDAAGTTPGAVDQPVGQILDISGNGNHASQSVNADRPTLRSSGGLYWLEFVAGVNDELRTGLFLENSLGFYAVVGLSMDSRSSSAGPTNMFFGGGAKGAGSITDNVIGLAERTDVVQDLAAAQRIGASSTVGGANIRNFYSIGSAFVGEGFQESGLIAVRVNNGQRVTSRYAPSDSPQLNRSLAIQSSNAMKFFGGIFVKREVEEGMKTLCREFLAAKSGVTL